MNQNNLLENTVKCSTKSRQRFSKDTSESTYALYKGSELTLKAFKR